MGSSLTQQNRLAGPPSTQQSERQIGVLFLVLPHDHAIPTFCSREAIERGVEVADCAGDANALELIDSELEQFPCPLFQCGLNGITLAGGVQDI